jgi:fluoroquinolone transport system permease protein
MKQLISLLKGELTRLYKYKILVISLFVSFLWLVIIALADKETAKTLSPMLIWMDGAMMSIIFIAASFYYEKQEQTIKSLLVSPVSISMVLLAKVIASLMMGLISGVLVVGYSMIVYQLEVKLLLLFVYILIVVGSHTAIGFLITLYSKDFSTMIFNYALFALIALVPSLLLSFSVIPDTYSGLLLLSPTHAGQVLINSAFVLQPTNEIIISIVYLMVLGGLLYPLWVYKKFKKTIIEE